MRAWAGASLTLRRRLSRRAECVPLPNRSSCAAELNAPVGYDAHSYGYRSAAGCKVHRGQREPYGAPFAEGDVVGMYLFAGDAPSDKPARAALARAPHGRLY